MIDILKLRVSAKNTPPKSTGNSTRKPKLAHSALKNPASPPSFVDDEPSEDPRIEFQQIRAFAAAYETIASIEPWLPHRDSSLPALLALNATNCCIKETRVAIDAKRKELQDVKKQLEKEQADLADAKLIQSEIQTRTQSLQEIIAARTQKTQPQIAKEMMAELMRKKEYYDEQTEELIASLNRFIDDHLSGMVAIEELGGPVVGDSLGIDEEMLGGAFTAQGKMKKTKVSEDKRQRRIDEIWGPQPDYDNSEEPWNEKRAAAAEIRELIEALMECLQENGPTTYHELNKDCAAARYLVRAKVAQLHPRDALKLRLLDFGDEVPA
jgi:hypothetical protein